MNLVFALAIVIGLMGGVATWLYLGPLAALGLQIWATFIGWASYFHCGGNEEALTKSIAANVWGALLATIGLFVLVQLGVTPVTAGICAGLSVAVMIAGAQIPFLGVIPAAVYGFAATAAFALLAGKTGALVSGGLGTNPFLTIVVSMVLGNIFGWISGKLAGALARS